MKRWCLLCVVSAVALVIPGAATAQQASASATQGGTPDDSSTEIVVTALKRSENLQRIPASISAISGDDLQDRGLESVQDLSKAIPSINFGEHVGATLITIRGVGSTVDSGVTEPTVATYVDGVFLPRATMGFLRGVDLDRVEVLRGPQGTLYGRNATGGAINFISALPTKSFTGGVNLSTGSRSALGVSGFVSGPLSSTIGIRLSGGHEQEDGYVRLLPGDRHIGNLNTTYARAAIRIEPANDFTVDLSARYERDQGSNAYQQSLTLSSLPVPQTTVPNRIYGDAPYRSRFETLVLAGTVNGSISSSVSLRSITSYVDHKSSVDFDTDATDLAALYVQDWSRPSRSFGQELNLIGETGRLRWILGAYYFEEKAGNTLPVGVGAAFAPGFGLPPGTLLIQNVRTRTKSIATFADATYSLTERLRLNLGLRYNHESKKFDQSQYNIFPNVIPTITTIPSADESNKVLPKVNLQADVSDDVSTYVQWSRGFKSGGQNLPGSTTGTLGLYLPETLDAYEFGLKTRSLNGRLTANFAAFFYDYSNLQLTISIPPATTLVQNAPARIYGLEGEVHYRITDAFRVDASVNLLHARFKNFLAFDDARPNLGTQNLNGQPLPHAPDFTGNIAAEYRVPIAAGPVASLTLRGDLFYSDRVVLRYFGTPNDSQKGYALENLSIVLAGRDADLKLRLFINNVANKTYRQNSTFLGVYGAYYGNYGPPRTWGAGLSYRF